MSGTTMLLLGLVLGPLLGAAVTLLVLRERLRSAPTQNRTGEDSADRLLRLADERHERDVARRDAGEEEREAELQPTLAPLTATPAQRGRTLARREAARAEAEGALRNRLGELGRRAQSLEQGTTALTAALRAPTSRGRWGEVQR